MAQLGDSKQVVAVRAPAKLNLALSVGPPGVDGMHPICSWMVTLDLCDELTVTRLAADRFSRYAILWHPDARSRSEIDWSITRDLAVRAHLAIENHVGRRLPVQLKLEKRIPIGGGLGGGSSNAAAMLRAVDHIYGLSLSSEELIELASGLGSDVPFFVRGGSALVEGLGEKLTPQRLVPPLHAVLAFPPVRCPTGSVYAMFDETAVACMDAPRVRELAQGDAARIEAGQPFNDLAIAATRVAPQLAEHLEALSKLAERPAHVAGSGSTLFVLCDDRLHAEALAAAVEKQLGLPAVAAGTLAAAESVE